MRLKRVMALGMVMAVFATGCQKAPEDAAVKEKNLDKMIEQAKDTKETGEAPENMAEKYNTYKNSFANEKLGVKVKAEAKVEIPKTNQMSIVRVEQKKIDQSFLDKVKKTLNLKQTFYDGSVTQVRTKSEIEKDIQQVKADLAGLSKDDENYKVYKEENEDELKRLQKEYENAPDSVDWNKYLSDGKIKPVKTLYEKNKNDDFYSWAYDLNKTGDIYYGVTSEEDKNSATLYVQNNEDYGNCFRFFTSENVKQPFLAHTTVGMENGNAIDTNAGMWPADRKPTMADVEFEPVSDDGTTTVGLNDNMFYEYQNEPTTISEKQAHETAEKFLKEIGLTDYQYNDGGLYCETFGLDDKGKAGYRKVWYMHYLRNLEGVLVNNDFGSKFQDGYQGSEYVKRMWGGESIDLCINDSGIVTFNYNSPVQITKKVVEKAKLKNFDKIQKTFEKMVSTVYAQDQEGEEKNEVTIKIDKVVLRYMRISEKDSFDTGLLVPVWDFLGTKKDKFGWYEDKRKSGLDESALKEESILTINAIDGSVIDKSLGY